MKRGGRYGAGVGVFTMWRTDVDPDEDVPVFDRESASNTDAMSKEFKRGGEKYYRTLGEMWRAEWIEPAESSERVRGDASAEQVSFIVDATGERWLSSKLDHEDIGRYLWFDPKLVPALLQRRGGGLTWYTQDTGGVWSLPDHKVHFGINRVGLITVYAYDVARLPIWQQRTWAAFNTTPDGAVSGELLSAQMRTQPANTWAPEAAIPELMDRLDELFRHWLGTPLFRSITTLRQPSSKNCPSISSVRAEWVARARQGFSASHRRPHRYCGVAYCLRSTKGTDMEVAEVSRKRVGYHFGKGSSVYLANPSRWHL